MSVCLYCLKPRSVCKCLDEWGDLYAQPVKPSQRKRRVAAGADSRPSTGSAASWKSIETLDRSKMSFVMIYEDGAMRVQLWNPTGYWEHPTPIGAGIEEGEIGSNPTHWMPLPEPPISQVTHGAEGHSLDRLVRRGICPQCQASLIFPNPRTSDGQAYCEECGWPDENRPVNPNCVRCGKGGTYCDGDRWLCDECSIAAEVPNEPKSAIAGGT